VNDWFVTSNIVTTPVDHWSMGVQKQEKEEGKTNMCYQTKQSREDRQTSYANDRIYSISLEKDRDLRKAYGLDNDSPPVTFNELMDRLNAGKYVIAEDKKDKRSYDIGGLGYVRWRDPAVKEDQAGYEAALEKLSAARTAAEDAVTLGDAAAQLQALKDFEAFQADAA
jgi:hypothetical protein